MTIITPDHLRQAAAKMRERAYQATPGPWEQVEEVDGFMAGRATVVKVPRDEANPWAPRRVVSVGQTRPHIRSRAEANVAHIASWHPAVALAVAGWLEDCAVDPDASIPDWNAAEVARIYLGLPQ